MISTACTIVMSSKKRGKIDSDALESENEARNGTISPIPSISSPMPISIKKNNAINRCFSNLFRIDQMVTTNVIRTYYGCMRSLKF